MMLWCEFQKWTGALCAWREARNQGRDGVRGVLHVIQNRSRVWNKSWAQIVYQPLQFSSMTYKDDPQLTKIPVEVDAVFEECYDIAEAVWLGNDYDLTGGATHYFADTIETPEWANKMTFTVQIGAHKFFK